MKPVFCIRPEPGWSATRAAGAEAGLAIGGMPLFAVEPVRWQSPDPARYDGLLIGSANVFRAGGPELAALAALPAHVVGEATAGQRFDLEVTGSLSAYGARGTGAPVAVLPIGLVYRGRDHQTLPPRRTIAAAGPVLTWLAGPVPTVDEVRSAVRDGIDAGLKAGWDLV